VRYCLFDLEISDIQVDRVAKGERIDANACGGFPEKLFDSLRVVGELFAVTGEELFLCKRGIGKLVFREVVGLIIAKNNISVFLLKENVNDTLYGYRLIGKQGGFLPILGEVGGRQENGEALLTPDILCRKDPFKKAAILPQN
jgi:hypothetical protein